ncbi:glycerate kinase [Brachybacterium huguangmaarense]
MRIVLAPDSFKESMTAPEAAAAMARGVRAVLPGAECVEVPMSDGGEGFTQAIAAGLGAAIVEVPVHDALGRPVTSHIAVNGTDDGDGGDSGDATPDVAALEVASAVGLDLIDPADRDVLRAGTRGVGELIAAALDRLRPGGRLVIGLGGSATTDGGAGMLASLGARLLDADGAEIEPSPASLERLARLDTTGLDPRLAAIDIEVACDVTNPLLGPRGASAVFGPQKGASPEDVERLDAALAHLVDVAAAAGVDPGIAEAPGAGAAGGLGWALLALTGARLVPGLDLVAETVGLADRIAGADLVLTGEGGVDAQTADGKTPAGVARLARDHGAPCAVLAGRVADDAAALLDDGTLGIAALVPIVPGAVDLPTALAEGAANLERATAMLMRLVVLGEELGGR